MTVGSALTLLPLVVRRPQRRQLLWEYRGEFALRGFLEITFMVAKLSAMCYLQAPYVIGIQRISRLSSTMRCLNSVTRTYHDDNAR